MMVTPDECDIRFAIASQRFVDAPHLKLRCKLPHRFDDCLGEPFDRSGFDRDRQPAIVTPDVDNASDGQGQDHCQDD
jgi:hypothetical protein